MSGPEGSSIKWNLARVASHRLEPDGFFVFGGGAIGGDLVVADNTFRLTALANAAKVT